MAAELPVTDEEMIAGVRSEYERLSSTPEGPHACFRYLYLHLGCSVAHHCARLRATLLQTVTRHYSIVFFPAEMQRVQASVDVGALRKTQRRAERLGPIRGAPTVQHLGRSGAEGLGVLAVSGIL